MAYHRRMRWIYWLVPSRMWSSMKDMKEIFYHEIFTIVWPIDLPSIASKSRRTPCCACPQWADNCIRFAVWGFLCCSTTVSQRVSKLASAGTADLPEPIIIATVSEMRLDTAGAADNEQVFKFRLKALRDMVHAARVWLCRKWKMCWNIRSDVLVFDSCCPRGTYFIYTPTYSRILKCRVC
jgi:hypothetical protein